MQIRIEYRFTSLNDYIDAERIHRQRAAVIKRDETRVAHFSAISAGRIDAYPVQVIFHWHRQDSRTDPDNIAFGEKFVLDGLVKAGVLRNDGWKEIGGISHTFALADDDYVIVEIESLSRYKVDGE